MGTDPVIAQDQATCQMRLRFQGQSPHSSNILGDTNRGLAVAAREGDSAANFKNGQATGKQRR